MQAAEPGQRIAVIGSGVAGLSCAWLLSQRHDVTLYEREDRLGGHAHTVTVEGRNGRFPVDTGFIVYNERTYPNLTALFAHLAVPTQESDMSFAASLRGGALEYAGTGLNGLFGQRRNLFRARFWSMLRDLRRLYRDAPSDPVRREADHVSLGDWLAEKGYGRALTEDHILPMAAAIWSGPPARMLAYPAAAFLKFFDNHGLLRLRDRPVWRTVTGGSEQYVRRLTASFRGRIRKGTGIGSVRRAADAVVLQDVEGGCERFDHVVIASHAHQALAMLADASPDERALLGAFGTSRNRAVLHADQALMPKRKAVWASWNFIGGSTGDAPPCVTYWMNSLQGLPGQAPTFITLNPTRAPAAGSILREQDWDHPVFDTASMQAQRRLWSLQGVRRTWFCGAWFGAGFHEDGVQAGLAVAEDLGGVRRPWQVAEASGRIHRHDLARAAAFA
jgi:predicted NAD/FAD-binding protein